MELIVNNTSFSKDFKTALGFVDADISFSRLKPSLELATDEIVDIITETNYQQITDELSGTENSGSGKGTTFQQYNDLCENKRYDFIHLLKYALLMKAFNMYVGLGDLSVSNNGRMLRRDEHTASAFQWQIEKHNENLEQQYYRHLDRLLRFMVKNNLEINQKKYKHSDLLVNSIDVFENYIDIQHSYALYIRLIPALREAEKIVIIPRTGKELFYELKTDVNSDIAFLTRKSIIYHALIWGFYKLDLQVFPKGMLSYNSINNTVNYGNNMETRLMRQSLALNFERDLERDLKNLEKIITKKQTPPEEITCTEIEFPDFGFNDNDGFVNT